MTLSGVTLAYDSGIYQGGGIYNAGTMTISGSTLSFDYAGQGGLGSPGNGIYNVGMLTVGTSTFVWDDISGSYTDGGGNTFN
jgi:hypothetical protein